VELEAEDRSLVPVALYTDGGVIKKNPSEWGGTYAWCGVNERGERVVVGSGLILAAGMTNNIAEFVAAVSALEMMPDQWSGKLYSDSQITLGRLCWGWKLMGIPPEWATRGSAVLKRLGEIEPVLLQGHPTRADLAAGIGKKRNLPVSEHNVWADRECQRIAEEYLRTLPAESD
jgi:ribonuclease HI